MTQANPIGATAQAALRVVSFRARPIPLEPTLVAARGDASVRLTARLLDSPDDELVRMQLCVADPDWLFVSAEGGALPWVDGVIYLAQEPAAPGLFVRTHREATVPAALLRAAVQRQLGEVSFPVALVDEDHALHIFGLSGLAGVDRAVLSHWMARSV